MKVYDELVARGLIAQVTNEEEIREMINNGKATFYIGFDPETKRERDWRIAFHTGLCDGCGDCNCVSAAAEEFHSNNKEYDRIGWGNGHNYFQSGRYFYYCRNYIADL